MNSLPPPAGQGEEWRPVWLNVGFSLWSETKKCCECIECSEYNLLTSSASGTLIRAWSSRPKTDWNIAEDMATPLTWPDQRTEYPLISLKKWATYLTHGTVGQNQFLQPYATLNVCVQWLSGSTNKCWKYTRYMSEKRDCKKIIIRFLHTRCTD